jgi:2-polyprenyl-6-methoxyphenol hydroxylase-like FAD-dependent oxidoreductase
MTTTTLITTEVAIVGAGPSGMMLAIELGVRGIPCVLVDKLIDPPKFPKANATSARTMEHYRRRGFAQEIRSLGLEPTHPQDVMYCTRLSGHELARFRMPTREEARLRTAFGDMGEHAWPTPELPQRAQQMFIEPVLRKQVARHTSVTTLYGWEATQVDESSTHAQLLAKHIHDDRTVSIQARYLVGCDGPRSLVRHSMGAQFEGASQEQRNFFGGQMLSIHFRSPDLYAKLQQGPLHRRAWQSWLVNPELRGLLVAVNGVDLFNMGIQLKPGQGPDDVNLSWIFDTLTGISPAPFDYQILNVGTWTAGYTLVCDKYREGRLFIAGDAAHLFTPTGGMGYNTSVDDAVNLGWKLAAVCQGWAPDGLLDTYATERRPIAHRNTAFARRMAQSIGLVPIDAQVESNSELGEEKRKQLGAALLLHAQTEFNIPGLQLGLRYESEIIATDAASPPPDEPNVYVPTGYPGARAPHMDTKEPERSLLDLFGKDFTLLVLSPNAPLQEWEHGAQKLGLPMVILDFHDSHARQLYGADLVLIRPDHHVAWRGGCDSPAESVLAQAIGRLAYTAT